MYMEAFAVCFDTPDKTSIRIPGGSRKATGVGTAHNFHQPLQWATKAAPKGRDSGAASATVGRGADLVSATRSFCDLMFFVHELLEGKGL
jgi:hypothetical protein